jgi:endothelin-converting enzyme/putative endopeptidase
MAALKFAPVLLLGILPATPIFGQASGLDLGAIDRSANPCADFYQYACGGWLKKNPIPADESSWGRFDELFQRNQQILRGILEDSAQHQERSAIDQKIGGFYQSCMNESAVEARGATPLKAELVRISSVANRADLVDEVARLHARQVPAFFSFYSSPDPKDARMTLAGIDQGGLGLPEKDYYFRTDQRSEEIRKKYVAHVAKIFVLAGTPSAEAQKKAAAVMKIETSLAKASLDVTARRDPQALVHEMQKSDLKQLGAQFDFNQYFIRIKSPEFTKLNVSVPDFVKGLDEVLANSDMSAVQDYLAWHYVHASARLLSKALVDENFDFYGRTLTGAEQQKPRWKRCVSATDDELGEALGRKFVEKTFGAEGKERTLKMVGEIESQMGRDIDSLTWMSPQTKKEAQVKLRAVTNKIGYPDKWRDYSSVEIIAGDYFNNWYRANEFENKRQLDKIGQPVDRAEWAMTPPTVNAYYDPTQNNINFPAGILQPPFYSNKAGDAVNYGAVGHVIGHELTHAFDDEGRQYDAEGNLKNWWQKNDETEFKKLTDCVVNEYGSFSPVPGIEINGRLTLGENTADNGGVRLAYLALLDDLTKEKKPLNGEVDGYTEAQRFFLGFAQVWCENQRPEESRLLAQTDPHSPAKFRVDGVVPNLPEFSAAFGCKAPDTMFAAKGCRVW